MIAGRFEVKGWTYQIVGNYKLNDDLTSSLNYVLFNVLFYDEIISTRILDEFPLEEECTSMMCKSIWIFLK